MSVFRRVARVGLPALAFSVGFVPSTGLARANGTYSDESIGGPSISFKTPRTDIIVTAVRAGQPAEQIGQAVTVLTRNTIDNRQTRVVSDLLAQTPGIVVSRNGGIGQTTAVRIRGAEDAQTLVLIDGVRVNDPASPGGSFDFGNLLIGNIDRIEVLRGPNSVPWGSQAIGGVVNVITAAPPASPGLRLLGEYGTRNAVTVVGQVGDTIGPVAASLGGGYFRDDGVSAFKFGRERDGFRQYAANGRVVVTLSDAVNIDLRGYYADSRVAYDGSPPPSYQFEDTGDYAKTQQVFGYAGINAALFDGALKNRLAYTLADTRRDAFSSGTDPLPSFIGRGRTERIEYQGDAALAEGVRAVFGAEHELSRYGNGTTRYSTGIDSGYLQAIFDPTDRLTLTGGARVDHHRAYGTKAIFSANAAWRPADGTVIRANYGEGFKAPTLFQLNSEYGNEDLQPETARSVDLGVEQRLLDGRLRVGVTAFHRDTTNQIDFFSCFSAPNPRCDQQPDGFYANIARTRAQGVETSLVARPTEDLTLTANYTLLDAKDRATGLALLRRPTHNLYAALDWKRDRFSLGGDVRLASDSSDFDYLTFERTRLDGYALVGLRASVTLTPALEVFGRLENAFDTNYESVSGYGTEGRSFRVGVRTRL